MPCNFFKCFLHETCEAKCLPKFLNFVQKNHRTKIAKELLNKVNDCPDLLTRLIANNKKKGIWLWCRNQCRNISLKVTRGVKTENGREIRSYVKTLLTFPFDYNGNVHRVFLPEGHIVGKEYYIEYTRCMPEVIHKTIDWNLWNNQLVSNAPAHKSLLVCDC